MKKHVCILVCIMLILSIIPGFQVFASDAVQAENLVLLIMTQDDSALGTDLSISQDGEDEIVNVSEEEIIEFCILAGIIEEPENENYLDEEPDCAEVLQTFIRLMTGGKEKLKIDSDFDLYELPDWLREYISYIFYVHEYYEKYDNYDSKCESLAVANYYTAFLLKALGYKEYTDGYGPENSLTKAVELNILTEDMPDKYGLYSFTRKDMLVEAFHFLNQKLKGQELRLIDLLIEDGAIDKDLAEAYGFVLEEKEEYFTSIQTSNNPEEYLKFEVSGNMDKLIITGKRNDPKKNYIWIMLVDEENNIGVYSDVFFASQLKEFRHEIDLSDIEAKVLNVEIYTNFERSGVYNAWIWEHVKIKNRNGKWVFPISPVYYKNKRVLETRTEPLNDPNDMSMADIYDIRYTNEKISSLAKQIVGEETDKYEIALRIHDWVADNIYYDWDAYLSGKLGDASALATLESRKSVCQGYANLTAALMRAAGIPCLVVSGYALGEGTDGWNEDIIRGFEANHAWNEAYIDGRWIIIDTTWDSGNRYYNGSYIYEGIRHRLYFDSTVEFFSTDHKIVE